MGAYIDRSRDIIAPLCDDVQTPNLINYLQIAVLVYKAYIVVLSKDAAAIISNSVAHVPSDCIFVNFMYCSTDTFWAKTQASLEDDALCIM